MCFPWFYTLFSRFSSTTLSYSLICLNSLVISFLSENHCWVLRRQTAKSELTLASARFTLCIVVIVEPFCVAFVGVLTFSQFKKGLWKYSPLFVTTSAQPLICLRGVFLRTFPRCSDRTITGRKGTPLFSAGISSVLLKTWVTCQRARSSAGLGFFDGPLWREIARTNVPVGIN